MIDRIAGLRFAIGGGVYQSGAFQTGAFQTGGGHPPDGRAS